MKLSMIERISLKIFGWFNREKDYYIICFKHGLVKATEPQGYKKYMLCTECLAEH